MGFFDDITKERDPDPNFAKQKQEEEEPFVAMIWLNTLIGYKADGTASVIKSYKNVAKESTIKKHQPKKKKKGGKKNLKISNDNVEEEDLF